MEDSSAAPARFEVQDALNSVWKDSERGRRITVSREPVIPRNAKVFAMGSCFAVEIRRALRAAGCDVYPKYLEMKFDRAVHSPGRLPDRDNINHYDTFVIRQEIERAVARRPVDPEWFWVLSTQLPRRKRWKEVWQNPLHRQVYASSREELVWLSHQLDDCIADGLAAAEIVIITLGLTECWRSRATGQYVCLGPSTDDDETASWLEFHPSGFAENLANIRATLEAIWRAWPDKRIVLTVSPVALAHTHTNQDIVVANSASKATLRAAVAEICREFPSVLYWPSYEFATSHDSFKADGRHVRADTVQAIVAAFLDAHLADPRDQPQETGQSVRHLEES